jgi:hypothetical protein
MTASESKVGSESAPKSQFISCGCGGSKLKREIRRAMDVGIKMEPWRFYISVEADVHNFDKEQDRPHQREKSNIKVKRGIRIRIRITVFQIRNTVCNIGPSGGRERRLVFLSFIHYSLV